MRTVWVCVLLSVLSIVAYSGFSGAVSDTGHPLFEMAAWPSIAAPPPSLDARVGPIALDASRSRPAPDSTREDSRLSAKLATYVFLHKTWNESISAPTTAELNVCSE